MKQKFIIFIVLILAGLSWFVWQRLQQTTNLDQQIVSATALEFADLIQKPEVFVLDVHTPEQTHLPETDAFIPYNQLEDNLGQLPVNKNTPIVVYCRSGSMSREASETLLKLGYTQVYDLIGGIQAYREAHVSVDLGPLTQDLGTVIYGEVAKTEFTLSNNTPSPLEITRLATSCGCTKATAAKMTLAPYEEVAITVTFDPAVHGDDTDLGDLTRTIYLDTNNPNFDHLTAQIQAVVVKK
ncbi:MAG TPA: DUF1573 domain-containing protein [Patescibacteria group bacterium]|jgi:rhodanese-related sulfurtransferase